MSTASRTTDAMGKGGAQGGEAAGAVRRDPHVWVLPMARILEIVRGTPIDAPARGAAPGAR